MPDKRKNPSSRSSGLPYAKRARPHPETGQDEQPPSPPSSPKRGPQPRNDPIYGQKHAFPGLDDPLEENELFYGPPEDGIEYLRMVRSEANKLPTVFVAQTVTETHDDDNSSSVRHHLEIKDGKSTAESRHKGEYSDGVYTAPPPVEADPAPADAEAGMVVNGQEEEQGLSDPQEIYYNLLRHRFSLLRSTLKCMPPSPAITELDTDHPISLPNNSRKARLEWRKLLQKVEPQMVQLACMDTESVLRLITVVTRSLSEAAKSEETVRVKRLGAWAWGLLGRCREVGQMGSEDVSEIRELGKRAVKILVKLRSPEIRQALEEASRRGDGTIEESDDDDDDYEEWGPDYGDGQDNQASSQQGANVDTNIDQQPEDEHAMEATEPGELEMAKTRLQQKLEVGSTNDDNFDVDDGAGKPTTDARGLNYHIFALLDMIISIVGEFYGQRDLLEFRDIWEEDDISR